MKNLNKLSLRLLIVLFFFFNGNQYKSIASKINNSTKLTTEYFNLKKDFNYIIGPGDRILIDHGPDLSELKVTPEISVEGTINLPRLNEIYVSGLTLEELRDLLNKKYAEYLLQPNVKVSIVSFRKVNAYILGEVNSPGLYYLDTLSTKDELDVINDQNNEDRLNFYPRLFDALKKAGGVTLYSDLSNIEITRVNPISEGGGYIRTNVNFMDALLNGNSSLNLRILSDDVIKVKRNENINLEQVNQAMKTNLNKKFINVFVSGRVIDPGTKQVSKSSVLNDAIAISGGTKVIKGKVLLVRYKSDGQVERRQFNYSRNAKPGGYKNPFLSDGDIIMVQRGPIAAFNETILDVYEPLYRFVNSYVLIKFINDN